MAIGPRSTRGAARPGALSRLRATVSLNGLLGRAVASAFAGSLLLPTPVFKTGQVAGSIISPIVGVPAAASLALLDSAGGSVVLVGNALAIAANAPAAAGSFSVTVRATIGASYQDTTFILVAATTAEAVAYFSRMTTKPASGVIAAIDAMIATLRGSTVWAKLDWLYFLAQDTYQAALLNVVGAYPLAIAGAPTFAARAGITGAANASLSNGVYMNAGTFANFGLNSAHVGAYITAASASTTAIVGTIADFTVQLLPRSGAGNFGAKVNTATTTSVAVASRAGHFCASRTAANANASYQNGGTAVVTSANAPTALPSSPLYLFRDAGNYATDQVAAFHGGAGLTQAENQTLYTALQTAIAAISALGAAPAPSTTDFDVVIYGGTLGALTSAQRLVNRGARVAIVEPTAELGGVGHHGLTYFDLGQKGLFQTMPSVTNTFFVGVNKVYNSARTTPAQAAEPKVYDQVFASTLAATGATVFLSSPLVTSADVRMSGNAITAIRTASGWITGRAFQDASYEGDLFALAGAPYQVGREGQAAYGEPDAGFYARRIADGGPNFSTDGVTPNNLYPVKAKPARADGAADNLIQPISYRFPITTAANRLPFPVPPGGYVASKMDQFVATLLAKNVQSFASAVYIGGDTAVPNSKFIVNNSQNNIFPSLELSGAQMGYPDGTPAQRQAVLDVIQSWTLHFFYCLQNDGRLSSALRADAANYGLCADEFTTNPIPGFPNMPYIRETRRLKGKYVMTQFDALAASNALNTTGGARTNSKSNRVAQWCYIQDSHAMELYADGTNNIVQTGNVQHTDVDPYDIPFPALHTDPGAYGHVSNLIVTLCYSATSVGWMSGRLEPNFAQLGEVGGEALLIMIEDGVDISAVSIAKLQRRIGSPLNTVAPAITGTPTVGQVLTCSTGTWSLNPTGYGYQWRRNGAAISGATASTYTPVSADAGTTLTCIVFATNIVSTAEAMSLGVLVAAATEDTDAATYLNAQTTPPSAAERSRVDAFVKGVKADGDWASFDWIVLLAAETAQAARLNVKNSAKSLTASNGPTFTANRGYAGDAVAAYLDLGEVFNAAGNLYAQDSASVGIWCNAQGATAGVKAQIGNVANSARTSISTRTTAGNETFQINDSTGDTLMASTLSRTGHRAASRTGSAIKRGFYNGTKVADLTTASVSINATNGALLRSGTGYNDDQLAAFYSGAGLSDAAVARFHARLNTYLTAKGAA